MAGSAIQLRIMLASVPIPGGKGGCQLKYEDETPFDSVEGAHEYLSLLSETLLEAKRDIEGDIAVQADSETPRRVEALRLVLYKLDKLEQHIKGGRRVLNDLRTLRRLLLQEREPTAGPRQK
jgi:hypothetical protein